LWRWTEKQWQWKYVHVSEKEGWENKVRWINEYRVQQNLLGQNLKRPEYFSTSNEHSFLRKQKKILRHSTYSSTLVFRITRIYLHFTVTERQPFQCFSPALFLPFLVWVFLYSVLRIFCQKSSLILPFLQYEIILLK
jgi:hypothetical protein